MKKSIFLLFLLLISCAPVAAVPPIVTPSPPSPTITPTPLPTDTPSPAPTPEGFRTSPEGNVQVFENGKWVDLKAPEGIWGPVDGTKVILVDDGEGNQEAFTQMELKSGFLDADGDNLLNVAKYNDKTKEWEVIDFTITRSPEEMKNHPKYGSMDSSNDRKINFISVNATLLGLKMEVGTVGKIPLQAIFLYKGKVFKVSADEIGLIKASGGNVSKDSAEPGHIDVKQALELINIANANDPSKSVDTLLGVLWNTLAKDIQLSDCDGRRGLPSSEIFNEWCENELLKGEQRKIANRANVEQALFYSGKSVPADSLNGLVDPDTLWDALESVDDVDGTWLVVTMQLNK